MSDLWNGVGVLACNRILLSQDVKGLRRVWEDSLRGTRYSARAVGTVAEARNQIAQAGFDSVLADRMLTNGRVQELSAELQTRPGRLLVIAMTSHDSADPASKCMRLDALHCLVKLFSLEQIKVALQKAEKVNPLVRVNYALTHDRDREVATELTGECPAMQQLHEHIAKVLCTDATVLFQSESGTGKELIAKATLDQSPCRHAPVIQVNCAAISEAKGKRVFLTGASAKRQGRFELAHGGTLLLNEVSEISPNLQAKLLRTWQEREFDRVGGHRTIEVDVRVIGTTKRQWEDSVARGEFRTDLCHHLNVLSVLVSPPCKRHDDIPRLAGHFLKLFAPKNGSVAREISSALLAMSQQDFGPGNVYELRNTIERAMIVCGSDEVIEPLHLEALRPIESHRWPPSPLAHGFSNAAPLIAPPSPTAMETSSVAYERFLTWGEWEREHVLVALRRDNDNRTHAARRVDIGMHPLRKTLQEYRYSSRAAVQEPVDTFYITLTA